MAKGVSASEILKLLLSAGVGAASANPVSLISMSVGGGGVSVPGMSQSASSFAARNYPDNFVPDINHIYDVAHIPGAPNFNSLGKSNMGTVEKAGRMQNIDEHNKAITQFLRPGMDPKTARTALRMGYEAEKRLPAFWAESRSREPFKVSSSAISGIRLTPDARIEVAWGTNPGKWYTFRSYPNTYEASLAAQKLLKADSIGRAVMPFQRHGKPLKFKDAGVAWWNRDNYDGAFA